MTSLLPPNASELERNLETVTERTTDLPVALRDLWNPDTCPENLLPWLAWALGVENWQAYWPESLKREKVRAAVNLKRRKGTAKSVRDAVAVFGATVSLRESWQQTPAAAPHSFDIAVDVNAMDGDDVDSELLNDIYAEVLRTKPARSYFSITTGVNASGAFGVLGYARPAIFRRLRLQTQISFTAQISQPTQAQAATYTRLNLSEG